MAAAGVVVNQDAVKPERGKQMQPWKATVRQVAMEHLSYGTKKLFIKRFRVLGCFSGRVSGHCGLLL